MRPRDQGSSQPGPQSAFSAVFLRAADHRMDVFFLEFKEERAGFDREYAEREIIAASPGARKNRTAN
jgi:hypothetical protein